MRVAVERTFGRIDVLVASAVASNEAKLWQTTEAEFDQVIDTNLKSAFVTVTQARPLLADGPSSTSCCDSWPTRAKPPPSCSWPQPRPPI